MFSVTITTMKTLTTKRWIVALLAWSALLSQCDAWVAPPSTSSSSAATHSRINPTWQTSNSYKMPCALEMASSLHQGMRGKENERLQIFDAAISKDNGPMIKKPSDMARHAQQTSAHPWTTTMNEFCIPVLSTALLITANEFGASSLVLPQLIQGPGLAASSGVFIGAYFINLLSGIILAEVAIRQEESAIRHDASAASSLKEIVETNLQSPFVANAVSILSISVNALVVAFALSRTGILAHQITGLLDASTMTIVWAATLTTLLGTQSCQRISNIASVFVTILFISFGSLLLPGLAQTNASLAWNQPGLAMEEPWWSALSHVAPIILMSLTFQNVVPTITRMHNYDRTKTVASMVLGSMIPLVMYVAWCVACLGGGIDLDGLYNTGGPMLAVFSLSALAGSSIGCGLSCASEMKTFIENGQSSSDDKVLPSTAEISLPTACVAIVLPLGLALATASWGNGDLTPALSVAGGIGSPLLYGILPVGLACNQVNDAQTFPMMVPTGSLGILGGVTGALFGSNVLEQMCHLFQLFV